VTLRLYCTCGDWLRGNAHPDTATDAIRALWAALHDGDDHIPTDARGALPGAMGNAGLALAQAFDKAAAIARDGTKGQQK